MQIARSPRTRSTLRAVLVEGDVHTAGSVRDMSSSGLFIDAPLRLVVGQRVAVVMGDVDGVRVPTEVVRVVPHQGTAFRFLGEVSQRAARDGVPELVLHEPDDAGDVVAPLPTPRRTAHKLVVIVHSGAGARRLHAVEIGLEGLFIVTDEPPRLGTRVHLSVQLPTRSVDVIAEVARVVFPRGASGEPGFGVHLLALPDDDRAAWDAYVRGLDKTVDVVIRPRTVAELRAFVECDFAASGTRLFTSRLCSPGDGVTVVVVHPLTDARFALSGIVVDACEQPRSIDVHFLHTDARARAAMHAFVDAGAPRALLALPAPAIEAPASTPAVSTPAPSAVSEASPIARDRLDTEHLHARIAALEEELAEAEHTERSLFARVHELESQG